MAEFQVPVWAQGRLVDRSKGRFAHDVVPAEKTALVVVDMQTYFLDSSSPATSRRGLFEIFRPSIVLARCVRTAGGQW